MKTATKLPKGFTRWDTAEILKTPRDIALYLEASLAEDAGDGRLVRVALGNIARARGMTQIAKKTGLTREGLYQALSKEGNPEFATVWKVMRVLGIRLHAKVA